MDKGLYIALEGMDGVGKSTVLPYVADYIKSLGREVVVVREIGSTPLGEKLRDILKSDCPMDATSELLLMLTARYQLFKDVVIPALKDGKVVISDRYYMSSIAYQCKGGGVSPVLAMALHKDLDLWSHADFVFILEKPFNEAISAQSGDDRFESSCNYQRHVYNFYKSQGAPLFNKDNCGFIFNICVDTDPNVTAFRVIDKLKGCGI